jgi:tetratricopeptide (TPR) repeat protein
LSDQSNITDDSQYDEQEELDGLIHALQLSQNYFLFYACCNSVPKQNELIERARASFSGKQIEVVCLTKPTNNLLRELRETLAGKKPDAVFVQGLERSIESEGEGADNLAVTNLNHYRDAFREVLSCPLVLWLPEYAIVKITNTAPDFFSIHSGIFYFSATAEKLTGQVFQSFIENFKEISSMPASEKLKRIETLEKLLSEYEALPEANRNRGTEARLNIELADVLYSISNFRKAIEYLKQALKISREIGDRLGEGSSLSNLGLAYRNLGEYRKAIEYHEQSLEIRREIGDRLGEGSSLGNLGNAYFSLGEYRKAVEYYEQTLEISREIGDRLGEGSSLNNLGLAYHSLDEYRKAIEYYEQSLKIAREIGDRLGEGSSLGNLGNAYDSLGEYRKAIEYHEQHLEISREIGDRLGESNSLNNLGAACNSLGETEKACDLWRKALAIYEAIESPNAKIVRQNLEQYCQRE